MAEDEKKIIGDKVKSTRRAQKAFDGDLNIGAGIVKPNEKGEPIVEAGVEIKGKDSRICTKEEIEKANNKKEKDPYKEIEGR